MKIPTMTIVVRAAFHESNKYYAYYYAYYYFDDIVRARNKNIYSTNILLNEKSYK